MLLDPAGGQLGLGEGRAAGHEPVERQGRLDAADLGLVERPAEARDRRSAVPGVDHDLGDQVVVLGRDPVAGLDPGVDTDARAGRHHPAPDPAGRRGEVAGRVLGRDPDLDRVPCRLGRPRGGGERLVGQRPPGRQPELLADDVEPRHQLRDAMLDLEPGVDLEELEGAVGAAQELGGRGVLETGRGRDPDRHRVEVAALVRRQPGRRRFLDQLLVTPLERAVALADGHHPPRGIAQQLDLDVAGRDDLALEIDRPVTERRGRLAGSIGKGGRQIRGRRRPAASRGRRRRPRP